MDMDILLRDLLEEDKEYYFEACKQEPGCENACYSDLIRDKLWSIAKDDREKKRYVIAASVNNQFCGFCSIETSGDTPEIGICLLSDYQGKGIGPKAITMMTEIEKRKRKIAYFLVRIENKNIRSIKMFEKLHVVKLEGRKPRYIKLLEEYAKDNPDFVSVINEIKDHKETVLNFALYV